MDILQCTHNNSPALESRKKVHTDLVESLITEEKSALKSVKSVQALLVEKGNAVLSDPRDSDLQQQSHHEKQVPELDTNLPAVTIDSQSETHHDPDWENLPAVVLYEIFSLLSFSDRLGASAVCWNWRKSFLDARLWRETSVIFRFGNSSEIARSRFLADRFARCVRNVTFQRIPDSYSGEFVQVLRQLSSNCNLETFSIDLASFMDPEIMIFADDQDMEIPAWVEMVHSAVINVVEHSSALKKLMLGGVAHNLAGIAKSLPDRLRVYQKRHLTHLGLASLLEVQDWSRRGMHEPLLNLAGFISLTTLTLNYSDLSDRLLLSLTEGTLERLVVHVHGLSPNHPGTTNAAWQTFRTNNPRCGLGLNILCSTAAIANADLILKPFMPLTHFKALFCECTSHILLKRLILYKKTLRSLLWIDSGHRRNYTFFTEEDKFGHFQFPMIYMHRKCKNLEELFYAGHIDDGRKAFVCAGVNRGKNACVALPKKNKATYDVDEFRSAIDEITSIANLSKLLVNEFVNGDSLNLIQSFVQKDTI